eukprot:183213-Amphidinium_carterae.5
MQQEPQNVQSAFLELGRKVNVVPSVTSYSFENVLCSDVFLETISGHVHCDFCDFVCTGQCLGRCDHSHRDGCTCGPILQRRQASASRRRALRWKQQLAVQSWVNLIALHLQWLRLGCPKAGLLAERVSFQTLDSLLSWSRLLQLGAAPRVVYPRMAASLGFILHSFKDSKSSCPRTFGFVLWGGWR